MITKMDMIYNNFIYLVIVRLWNVCNQVHGTLEWFHYDAKVCCNLNDIVYGH